MGFWQKTQILLSGIHIFEKLLIQLEFQLDFEDNLVRNFIVALLILFLEMDKLCVLAKPFSSEINKCCIDALENIQWPKLIFLLTLEQE